MTYPQALAYIHRLHRFGRKPELTRIQRLLAHLGDPQKQLKFIHVAGTNGKGSTTVMLSAILRAAGYRTGTYTSPYIVDFRERIVLDGEMITEAKLAQLTELVAEKAALVEAEYEAPREFEFITALALLYYAQQKADIVVLEVGLGGRFDATNAIDPPLAAVIAPIGLDHTQLLGDTVEAIAGEKCGIIKPGTLVVTNPCQPHGAMDVIINRCRETGCPLVIPQLPQLTVESSGLDGSRFTYHGYPFRVALAGPHQVENAVTAIDTALALGSRGWPLTIQQIHSGIATAYIPGRLEVYPGNPTVLLDGAHNPHGTAALRDSLFAGGVQDAVGVVGMLADKNCLDALNEIAPYLGAMIVTQPDSPRALPTHQLAKLLENYCSDITIEPDRQKAIGLALAAGHPHVVVFGSLYLVADLRPTLEARLATSIQY